MPCPQPGRDIAELEDLRRWSRLVSEESEDEDSEE